MGLADSTHPIDEIHKREENPSFKKKIFPIEGFLPQPWSAEEGTSISSNHGSADHEAKHIRLAAVPDAGASRRELSDLGRERRAGRRVGEQELNHLDV